jgi:hypothetical protein
MLRVVAEGSLRASGNCRYENRFERGQRKRGVGASARVVENKAIRGLFACQSAAVT